MFKTGLDFELLDIKKDTEGRYLSICVKMESQSIRIVNLYAPNEDKPDFFTEVLSQLNEPVDHIVVVGDLNVILNPRLDRYGGQKAQSKSSQIINAFLEEYEWVDIWRMLHSEIFQFTWKRNRPLIMSRLDYILIPLATANFVEKCEILPSVVSDHCPIMVQIATQHNLWGPGYWKLNVKHIQNKE